MQTNCKRTTGSIQFDHSPSLIIIPQVHVVIYGHLKVCCSYTLAWLFRPRNSIHFNCLYHTHIFLVHCWGEISEFHHPQPVIVVHIWQDLKLIVEEMRLYPAAVCPVWTRAELCQDGSSSPPPVPPSEGYLSQSERKKAEDVTVSDTHRWIGTREKISKTTHRTKLTWLANMREHLVLSAGSAVILRINCSIGVIPERAKDATVSGCCQERQCHFLV